MTRLDAKIITRERLEEFAGSLAREFATPAFLLGISHDPDSLGTAVICTVEDLDRRMLIAFLRSAADTLESGPVVDRDARGRRV